MLQQPGGWQKELDGKSELDLRKSESLKLCVAVLSPSSRCVLSASCSLTLVPVTLVPAAGAWLDLGAGFQIALEPDPALMASLLP